MQTAYTFVNFINGALFDLVVGTLCLDGTLDSFQCAAKFKELNITWPASATAFKLANTIHQDPRVANPAYLAVVEQHKNRLLNLAECELFEAALKATVPTDLWEGC